METLEWSDLRDRANTLFGQFPNAETEQDIIDVFMVYPQQVKSLIEQVATGVQAGRIRSGWAILRAEVLRSRSDRNATVTDAGEREKKIRQAETWVRNAGIHLDRVDELGIELFGDRGLLEPWSADPALRQRFAGLWSELRPRGERVEREAIERAETYKQVYPERLAGTRKPGAIVKEMPK